MAPDWPHLGELEQWPDQGEVLVDGNGSSWTVAGTLHLGGDGTEAGGEGLVTVDQDATLTVTETLKIWNTPDPWGSYYASAVDVVDVVDGLLVTDEIELDGNSVFQVGAGSTMRANTLTGFGDMLFGGNLELGRAKIGGPGHRHLRPTRPGLR